MMQSSGFADCCSGMISVGQASRGRSLIEKQHLLGHVTVYSDSKTIIADSTLCYSSVKTTSVAMRRRSEIEGRSFSQLSDGSLKTRFSD